ncbi:MAG TPA: MBL fold metallo-hydrolase [Thermoplasmatales archaeon]|nr:MBL fold metallo-hydrolase [Thermoplasmatales archaeon]
MLKVHALGGYNEVGRNMTCIEIDREAIILDMGLYMDRFIAIQEKNGEMNREILQAEDAIPNDEPIKNIRSKIKGILITHAHLDHMGAIRWMASKYKCPVITTPFTAEVIKRNSGNSVKLITVNVNSSFKISNNIEAEFINVTHSVPQSTIINLKTKYGSIVYALDYKNDNHPTLGRKTNIKKLRKIDDVILLIADSTNADEERKTFSEHIAREMLKDIMVGMETDRHGLFLTTFSSHIARLRSMLQISETIGRKTVFLGRSLSEYISSAEKIGIVNFSEKAEIIGNTTKANKKLKEMNEKREDYIFIVTGGLGEKNAVLTRIVNDELNLKIFPKDFIVFSCEVIPTPTIQANRKILEHKLHRKKARLFKDIHVSGHASREDLRDLIKILSPQNILPAHGDLAKTASLSLLGWEMGYELGKDIHIMQNGQSLDIA